MRPIVFAPVILLLMAGTAFAANEPSQQLKEKQHQARRHVDQSPVRSRKASGFGKAAAPGAQSQDTEDRIKQIPASVLGPPGNRIPEVGPPPPKAEGNSAAEEKQNTANCTGSNAGTPACYTATQQTRGR